MPDIPLFAVAMIVTFYWGRVGWMVRRARRQSRDLAGLVPEQRTERLAWIVWVPLVAAWIALPWFALVRPTRLLGPPAFASEMPYGLLRWVAAIVAVAALLLTIQCWKRMGRDWRMDVSDKNRAALITDGLYARVRHPIYSLSILLMLATVVVLPTFPMLAIAVVHVALMMFKAHNEERHLLALHGQRYADYLARTGRFLPRAQPPSSGAAG